MMKKSLLFLVLFVLSAYVGFAQENEKSLPKGRLLEMPVSPAFNGYQTERVLLEVSPANGLDNWKKVNWKAESGVVSSQPFVKSGLVSLESPAIQLPALKGPDQRLNLYLEEAFEIESYHDQGLVQVSADQGRSWQTLSVSTGKSEWRTSVINLTSYAGKSVQLAFKLDLDAATAFKGWSIRHISLKQEVLAQANASPPLPAPSADGARTMGVLNGQYVSTDAQKFPRYVYAQVKVSDGTTPLTTLREPNFYVREYVKDLYGPGTLDTLAAVRDSSFKVYPPLNSTVKKPVDIVFLMDNSGSMGDEQAQVRANVANFVNELELRGFDYRLALCRFGQAASNGIPLFHNNAGWYKGTAFTTMWQAVNTVDGANEPSWDALYQSTTQYSFLAGSQKVFILITDESITGNNLPYNQIKDRQIVINKLLASGVKTYTLVPAGSPFDSDFGAIATATGGRSYNITAPFTGILNDIGTDINNTYTIRYTPTNPTFDGLKRDVEVKATYNGSTITLLGQYTPGAAPILLRTDATLALHKQGQAQDIPITISVEAIDYDQTITNNVTLYYRFIAKPGQIQGPYKPLTMVRQSIIPGPVTRSIWAATIPGGPAGDVKDPGIQYYFRASDGVATTTAPEFLDRPGFPFSFAVLPNVAPVITHTPIATADPKAAITFSANVTDNTINVSKVYLYYMKDSDLTWSSAEMTLTTAPTYQYVMQALNTNTVLSYYIVAEDNFRVSTFHGESTAPHAIGVGTLWTPSQTDRTIFQNIRFAPSNALQKATVTIGGTPLVDGDVIGAFFTDNGQLKPAGTLVWRVGNNINNLTVYGDDPQTAGVKEGYTAGEAFTFKIFRKADGKIFDCIHSFYSTGSSTFQVGRPANINELKGYLQQSMALKRGINLWSTNLIPINAAFADLFAPIAASVERITDAEGRVFVPGATNNTLVTYLPGYGYQVVMKAAATLTVQGTPDNAASRTVSLSAQGTIVGTPYASPENVQSVFPRNTANIYIIDRYITHATTGELTVESYSPAWDLNDWTNKNMEPGQGYYVYVYANQSFTFPASRGAYPARIKYTERLAQKITSSSHYMHLYVLAEAWNSLPGAKDEIRVYNSKAVLVGRALASEEGSIVTLDGTRLSEGEPFSVRYWDQRTGVEAVKSVTAWKAGSDRYENHRVSVIGSFEPTSEELQQDIQLWPNPAVNASQVVFTVKGDESVSIDLFNSQGRLARQVVQEEHYAGGKHEVSFKTEGLSKGLYLVRVRIGQAWQTRQLLVQ